MKKAVIAVALTLIAVFAIILVPVAVISLTSCSNRFIASDTPEAGGKYVMASLNHGFILMAPKSWEGKVEINEDKDFVVTHKTISKTAAAQNPMIFTIVEYGSREKWDGDSKKKDEPFPYKKAGEIDGKVYAYILPFDIPYDDKSPEDLDEYTKIMKEVKGVLKTFMEIPCTDRDEDKAPKDSEDYCDECPD